MAQSRSRTVLIVVLVCGALFVPCMGITAALAIPAFVNYARRAKTAEARANVETIRRGVEAYCASEHPPGAGMYPGAAGPTPLVPNETRQVATWGPEWATVGFAPMDPVYYSYSLVPVDSSTFIIRAEGDLDGDGERSRYESHCTFMSAGACSCDGALIVTEELE